MGKLFIQIGNWFIKAGNQIISFFKQVTLTWDAFIKLLIINKEEL
jgi:hypothetical protein